MKLYHEVDASTDQIIQLTDGVIDPQNFCYVIEQANDWMFLHSWRKSWPNTLPLLSDLKVFRRYINAGRRFKAICDRAELQQ
ncbi:hypothetical protein [Pseudomonas kielensis]|uniref:Uncharacterized protein n=1 Tax=Pseudomonas kielensis TaxID=2762577 RepID=A0A7X1GHT8_9PSED|nr:hypothetical protein [Pseudomonas kielensis]MBC2692745.1 hypothetical protein [Pseudomonas kielensis]